MPTTTPTTIGALGPAKAATGNCASSCDPGCASGDVIWGPWSTGCGDRDDTLLRFFEIDPQGNYTGCYWAPPGTGANTYWNLSSDGTQQGPFELSCLPGNSLVYGAGLENHAEVHWGVSLDHNQDCTTCTVPCDGSWWSGFNLTCGDSGPESQLLDGSGSFTRSLPTVIPSREGQ